MEIPQVLNTLQLEKLPPADVLEEIIEEEVFHLRDYFLRNPVVKPLYSSRIRKLNNLLEIQNEYCEVKNITQEREIIDLSLSEENLLHLIQSFENSQADMKIRISATMDIEILISHVKRYIDLQEDFENKFKRCYSLEYPLSSPNYQVKLADQLTTGTVIRLLVLGKMEDAYPLLEKEFARILLIS